MKSAYKHRKISKNGRNIAPLGVNNCYCHSFNVGKTYIFQAW